jgi:hypothetical protein
MTFVAFVAACIHDQLGPDEIVLAAVSAAPAGLSIAAPDSDAGLDGPHGRSSLAARFPNGFVVVVVTDARVLVFRRRAAGDGRPRQLLAEFTRRDVVAAPSEANLLRRVMVLRFADGSAVPLDASGHQRFDEFDAIVRGAA